MVICGFYYYLTYVMIGGANPQLAIRSGQLLSLYIIISHTLW